MERWTRSDSFSYWFTRRWLVVFNVLIFLYVGLPFLAPIMMKAGFTAPASAIYRVYGITCHQLAYRSFFLFGEQAVYPRAQANVDDLQTFSQATGLEEDLINNQDVLAARRYYGNEHVGYKVALCQRDVAIYTGILAFGLLYGLTHRRIRSLPWYIWLTIGILPIAIDGFSQLLGVFLTQYGLAEFISRESTPFLRVLTGFLFGFTSAWFGYPYIQQSMDETRQLLEAKRTRIMLIQKLEDRSTA